LLVIRELDANREDAAMDDYVEELLELHALEEYVVELAEDATEL
jgi:hypothetical protein